MVMSIKKQNGNTKKNSCASAGYYKKYIGYYKKSVGFSSKEYKRFKRELNKYYNRYYSKLLTDVEIKVLIKSSAFCFKDYYKVIIGLFYNIIKVIKGYLLLCFSGGKGLNTLYSLEYKGLRK